MICLFLIFILKKIYLAYNDDFDEEDDECDQYSHDKLSRLYLNYKKKILKEFEREKDNSDSD